MVNAFDRDFAAARHPLPPREKTRPAEERYHTPCSSTPLVGFVRARPVLLVSSISPVCARPTCLGAHVCVTEAPNVRSDWCRRSSSLAGVHQPADQTDEEAKTDV
eukprot:scaffold682_cov363-Pavlova_lutheri.AAC.37